MSRKVIKMVRKEYYRGIEDPISGTFKLAEEVSSKADRILFKSIFSLYFAWFGLIISGLVTLVFLFSGKFFLFIIFLSLFVTGIVTVLLLRSVRAFLRKASFRFSAIQAMREGPPFHRIPKGKNMTERFLKYLKKENRSFERLLKKRPEVLGKDGYVVGKKKRHHFDAFITLKPSFLHSLRGRGKAGYSLFIRELKHAPGMDEVKEIVGELRDIQIRNRVHPSRVVILFKASKSYSGIDDDVYNWLVDRKVSLPGRRSRIINFQAVAELPDGNYDFIPFIPELDGYLP